MEFFADVLLNACIDIGLAVNTGKTKYMEIRLHRGMIENAHIKIGSNSYEKGRTFKYLGSLLANQNSIQESLPKKKYRTENGQMTLKHPVTRIYLPTNNSPLGINRMIEPEIDLRTSLSVENYVTTAKQPDIIIIIIIIIIIRVIIIIMTIIIIYVFIYRFLMFSHLSVHKVN